MLDLFEKYLSVGFEYASASKPLVQVLEGECTKIRIRPVSIKDKAMYQVTRTIGAKEVHKNLEAGEAAKLLEEVAGKPFGNIEVVNNGDKLCVMVSKKGHMTVKEHKKKTGTLEKAGTLEKKGIQPVTTGHNKEKNYIFKEGVPIPFLVKLGIMTPAGKVVAAKYDKFKQINRYLEFIEDVLPSLPKDKELSVIDFGCGKSYLTFAMYNYLHEMKGYDLKIIGLDLKKDVIENCNALAAEFGYNKLRFFQGDIANFNEEDNRPDMVVTLHACDTATDYALEKAVKWGATVILCVPCCQHELNRQIKCDVLSPIMKYGLLKERFAALLTDGLRAEMLEEAGYRTQVLEFIDMEHTPKNILIRAVRQPLKIKRRTGYEKTAEFLNAKPLLQKLLFGEAQTDK